MARTGLDLTEVLTIEARQHELLGMELGEGPKRSTLKLGALIGGVWLLVAVPVSVGLGLWASLDVAPFGFAVAVIPPSVLLAVALRPLEDTPSRIGLVPVVLRIRYVIRGHMPVIRLGVRRASSGERIPLLARLAYLLRHDRDSALPLPGVAQPVVAFGWRARLYGRDYQQVLERWMTKKGRADV